MEITEEELQFLAAGLQQKLAAAEVDILRLQYKITKLEAEKNATSPQG